MVKQLRLLFSIFVVFIFTIASMLLFIGCSQTKNSKVKDKSNTSVEKANSIPDSIKSIQMAVEEMKLGWHYEEIEDKMGKGTIKGATTLSQNTISLNFPYQGAQHGAFILRSHPRNGSSVMVMVEKGQFLTGVDGCRVMVRFDEGNPMPFWANEPEDHTTTAIFISDYSKFVTKLMSSKKVLIEAPFFQGGRQVFEFKVDSLRWSLYTDAELKAQKDRLRQQKEADQEVHDLLTKPGLGPFKK